MIRQINCARMRAAWQLLLPLTLIGSMHSVLAQELRDPTRPPTMLTLPTQPNGSVAATQVVGPQLQSVRISAHHASAIISGQQVRVGDQVGGNRVVAISENEVTLRGPGGLQILKLFPGISKHGVSSRQRHAR